MTVCGILSRRATLTQGEAQRQPLPLPSLRGILSRMRGSEATGPRRCGSSRRRSSRQLRRADQDGTPCPAAGSSPGGPKALIISRNARYMGLSFSPLYGKIYASRHIKRKKRGNCYDRSSERRPQGISRAGQERRSERISKRLLVSRSMSKMMQIAPCLGNAGPGLPGV